MPDRAAAMLALVQEAFCVALGQAAQPDEDFFDLGGDSIASEAVLMRLEDVTGVALPGWTLLDHPTAREIAAILESQVRDSQ